MQKHPELPAAFSELGIEVRFLKALKKMGFEKPSEIQSALLPPVLEGRDVLGQARTGTGKTAAFGLPTLQQIDPEGRLQAICLAPTRELAVQVAAELKRLSQFTDLHIVAVYGGQRITAQLHQLGNKPHFVVGTPGRVMDLMQRGALRLGDIRFAVLDEVDRMLDIGFRDDIRRILSACTGQHQTIFVSATIEDEIRRLAQRYLHDPLELNVSKDRVTVDEVDQSYYSVEPRDKFRLLKLLIDRENPKVSIVFTNTKAAARKLSQKLFDGGIAAKEIHGDLMQRQRDRVMDDFRKHRIRVLVATDLAARGIDVSAISHIFNYDIPVDPEVYVHRIGRTARMGNRGVAMTFVTSEQGKEITAIEMLINREIPEHKAPGFNHSDRKERDGQRGEPRPSSPTDTPARSENSTSDGPATPKRPRKTLGGKFRPARRRRL